MNNLFRQSSPEEELLIRLFEPNASDNPLVTFLMPFEITNQIQCLLQYEAFDSKVEYSYGKAGV